MHCRQCGFEIIEGSDRPENRQAERRGFCTAGCREAYERMREIESDAARAGMKVA